MYFCSFIVVASGFALIWATALFFDRIWNTFFYSSAFSYSSMACFCFDWIIFLINSSLFSAFSLSFCSLLSSIAMFTSISFSSPSFFSEVGSSLESFSFPLEGGIVLPNDPTLFSSSSMLFLLASSYWSSSAWTLFSFSCSFCTSRACYSLNSNLASLPFSRCAYSSISFCLFISFSFCSASSSIASSYIIIGSGMISRGTVIPRSSPASLSFSDDLVPYYIVYGFLRR